MQAMNANMQQMGNEIKGINSKMEKMQGEMRHVGQCLQAGITAAPRAGANELGGGECGLCRPRNGGG